MSSKKIFPGDSTNGSSGPPDYVTFKPCAHIQQVLASQARDTVLRNYSLGLKVSLLSSNKEVSYKNLENGTIVDHKKILKLRSKLLKCKSCSNNCGLLFMCLQCSNIGCFKRNHAFNHAKSAGHVFGIESNNGHLYCFRCGDYVSDPKLEEVRIAHINNSNNNVQGLQVYPIETDKKKKALILSDSRAPSLRASRGLRGFVNMGSTCFMSVILQTLIHNPFIRDYYLSGKHLGCDKEPLSCIPCCIDDIFAAFYTMDENKGFGPTALLTAAWKVKRSLAGYTEQDAHEFWQFLLDEMHKADILLLENKTEQNNQKKIENDCPCITHRTFSGELQSSITCSKCRKVTTTIDPMLDLSLEILQQNRKVAGKSLPPIRQMNLLDCLKRFTTPEKLDVLYNCSTCGHKTMVYKQLKIKKLPPVLGIQLKRFEHLSTSAKIETHVTFPLMLNMYDYILHDHDHLDKIETDLTYELFALVCHIGSVNTGHYVCLVKNRDGNWFKFDDSKVTLVSIDEVTSTKAYLLYYIIHDLSS
ncbi:hypothetical protein PACTADRAFT_41013 [Pachysolen tannophilus NRRL Y-2460]|uniref:Ubiquitin carboxyl-terminal hydrolase n=1 Tax=Pachysolen tannophilus NRRL Y-2460 TaxID=669874 RepID=A0A1E4TW11_PACTA|nr:hypothetical protein PACTADRAFT_41013 [Pachysolen tannophilus NRRL Y-2460]